MVKIVYKYNCSEEVIAAKIPANKLITPTTTIEINQLFPEVTLKEKIKMVIASATYNKLSNASASIKSSV